MEHHARLRSWSSYPIAERMSFSSFSHSVDDTWAYDVKRPYQIVLLPGYRVPASLDRGDKDALWFHKEEVRDRPVIVWDGYSPTALFEIIRECFDYEGSSEFIAVRDVKTGRYVKDERDPRVLALRPPRKAGWGPKKIYNHIVELLIWSRMFPAGNETTEIYAEMLVAHGGRLQNTRDSYERAQLFIQRGMQNVDVRWNHEQLMEKNKANKIRINRACVYGSDAPKDPAKEMERVKRDAEVGSLDIGFHAMAELGDLTVDDFPDGPPESYYRAALKAGQGSKSDPEVVVYNEIEKKQEPSTEGIPDTGDGKPAKTLRTILRWGKKKEDQNPF